jgi:hypothetical protein
MAPFRERDVVRTYRLEAFRFRDTINSEYYCARIVREKEGWREAREGCRTRKVSRRSALRRGRSIAWQSPGCVDRLVFLDAFLRVNRGKCARSLGLGFTQ